VSLAEAREAALAARRLLLAGLDPIEDRDRRRAEARRVGMTFREAAEQVISDREGMWRSATHRGQWRSTLAQYVFPIIGDLPVAAIDTPDVLRCVKPIWAEKQVTADRIRQRIEAVLNWSAAGGHRPLGTNPARWSGHLQHILVDSAEVKHLAAMPWADVPKFIEALRAREGIPPRALEFTILTACRTGEVLGATWAEVEGDAWTIPAGRMKGGREHRVPLSARALEILAALPREGEFIFIGARAGRPLNRHTMRETMEAMGLAYTVHGFRSSFRDWASECTRFEDTVCEAALAHTIPSKVEAAYRRGDLLVKRRQLMTSWAAYCGGEPVADNVTHLRRRTDA
jgi:integrase